jgi:hypothetical protein
MDKGVGIERAAETVFELADKHVRSLTDGRCWVNKVEVFEHEDNSAVYTESNSAVEQETIKTTYSFNAEADLQPAVTTPVETVTQQQSAPNRGAAVGNGVSQGMSNPFAGTSWGA